MIILIKAKGDVMAAEPKSFETAIIAADFQAKTIAAFYAAN
jgi:hypothetical protein